MTFLRGLLDLTGRDNMYRAGFHSSTGVHIRFSRLAANYPAACRVDFGTGRGPGSYLRQGIGSRFARAMTKRRRRSPGSWGGRASLSVPRPEIKLRDREWPRMSIPFFA